MENYGSGMVQPGKWTHKDSGHEIFVKDSVIDGDHMLIITNEGMLDMNEFQNYIQISDEEFNASSNGVQTTNNSDIMSQINKGLDSNDRIEKVKPQQNAKLKSEDKEIFTRGLGIKVNKTTDTQLVDNNKPKKEVNQNYKLIEKVFEKFPAQRTIKLDIIESEWPFKEFNMLVNILDVPIEDICKYIVEKYLNIETISNTMKEYISQYIDKK